MDAEGSLRSVALADVERARSDERLLEHLLRRELPRELIERKLASGKPLPFEVRAHYEALLEGPPPGVVVDPALDLHKAWQGIHYLLTGEAWGGDPPGADAVLGVGGEAIGPDLGHGPARCLTPEQVERVAEALEGIDEADLRRRYDPDRMTALEIAPKPIWKRSGEDNFGWLMQFYQPLPGYYAAAARAGRAMLVWLA